MNSSKTSHSTIIKVTQQKFLEELVEFASILAFLKFKTVTGHREFQERLRRADLGHVTSQGD